MSKWTPLTDDDPLRTEDDLDDVQRTYARAAANLRQTAQHTRTSATVESWSTEAAKALGDQVDRLCDELMKASDGMAEASEALMEFRTTLDACENDATMIVRRAREVADERASVSATFHATDSPTPDPDPVAQQEREDTLQALAQRDHELHIAYQALDNQFWEVVDSARVAATRAAARVQAGASEAKELNLMDHIYGTGGLGEDAVVSLRGIAHRQSWWGDFMKAAPYLRNACLAVGAVAAIVVIVCTAPVWGTAAAGVAAVAAIAGAVGVVTAVVALVLSSAMAVDSSGSWSDVAMDSLTAATMGVGSLLSRSLGSLASVTNRGTGAAAGGARGLARTAGSLFKGVPGASARRLAQLGKPVKTGTASQVVRNVIDSSDEARNAATVLRQTKNLLRRSGPLPRPRDPIRLERLTRHAARVERRLFASRVTSGIDRALTAETVRSLHKDATTWWGRRTAGDTDTTSAGTRRPGTHPHGDLRKPLPVGS